MHFFSRWSVLLLSIGLISGCLTWEDEVQSDSDDADTEETEYPGRVEPAPPDPDAPEEFTETDSGLKYRVLRKGDGEMPKASDTVTVHYKGWLDNGTVFDGTYSGESTNGDGQPISFPLEGVIPGWTEGLQYVAEGGMIELEIPFQLGYGESGSGPIPPKATLHFIVELEKIGG